MAFLNYEFGEEKRAGLNQAFFSPPLFLGSFSISIYLRGLPVGKSLMPAVEIVLLKKSSEALAQLFDAPEFVQVTRLQCVFDAQIRSESRYLDYYEIGEHRRLPITPAATTSRVRPKYADANAALFRPRKGHY